jgi:ferredoxin
MNPHKVVTVCFSPTGTTRKILKGIAQGLKMDAVSQIDLTLPAAQSKDYIINRSDLAIIGVPVYAGRVPVIAVRRLKKLRADKTPAVIVVVYGNRDYEDALLELSRIVKEAGFVPVAAGAFIGEHSFSNKETPIAAGRPDQQDMMQAMDFGEKVMKKVGEMSGPDADTALPLPGNFPHKDYGAWPEISPVIIEELCNLCGECAAVCPTAAITVDAKVLTDKKKCIICCACVKTCPLEARVMEEAMVKQIAEWLSTTFRERKDPDIFI